MMKDSIDEFESMFRRAEREPYVFAEVAVHRVTLVTDKNEAQADSLAAEAAAFLPALGPPAEFQRIVGGDYSNVGELLERLARTETGLVVTHRHLQETAFIPQHSLGVYVDVLTQATTFPVLLLPGSAAEPASLAGRVCRRVMVVTDHISGDNRLINYGVWLCGGGGELWLSHVEDDIVFERYMHTIERIPEIETAQARRLIGEQLLKDAQDFIDTCLAELQHKRPDVTVRPHVGMGHHLREYRRLVDTHDIDLVVANTKDKDQMAMHGMTYSLSIEMPDVPMLLL